MPAKAERLITLPDAEATAALGRTLAARARPGDAILLEGPTGAGKSHLARAFIRAAQRAAGAAPEEVPSPTYTLVQTYAAGGHEIWHADLYRLAEPSEAWELGLDAALSEAVCLIEWPDRLGSARPDPALAVTLRIPADHRGREARLEAPATLLDRLLPAAAAGDGGRAA